MKKLTLIVGIFIAGLTNAKSLDLSVSIADETEMNYAMASLLECGTFVYHSTCGFTAITCQENWTSLDGARWGRLIEENYCSDDSPFSPTSGLN